jgi:hypothetical protein
MHSLQLVGLQMIKPKGTVRFQETFFAHILSISFLESLLMQYVSNRSISIVNGTHMHRQELDILLSRSGGWYRRDGILRAI